MKGISPLIAAVMVIAITVLIGVIFTNWTTTFFKKEQATVLNKTSSCQAGADITVEEVYIDFPSNTSRIIARNSGTSDQSISSAAVINSKGQFMENTTAFPIGFPAGSLRNVEFRINGSTGKILSCGEFSKALVTADCGTGESFKGAKCS